MALILNTRKVNGHIIVEVTGRLQVGESAEQLRELTKRLASDGGTNFIINMSGISHVDSSGLGLLLSIYATIRNQGGDLKLLNPGNRVKELLRTTGLSSIFQTFEDETQALQAKSHNA